MTKYTEIPLREIGKPWPGLKTETGKVMRIPGEMSDCTNVIIDRPDVLEKRKGFIRAFDERFPGVVCGLFKYTDDCGQEYVLVAHEDGFAVRTPFLIPTFTVADCYPNDSFDQTSGSALSEANWRNASGYEVQGNAMVQVDGSAEDGDTHSEALDSAARWFKDACGRSYQLQVEYSFDSAAAAKQKTLLAIRGNDDLSGGAVLFAVLEFRVAPALYRAQVFHRNAAGTTVLLASQALISGQASGFLNLRFDSDLRIASLVFTPNGAGTTILTASPLTELAELDLGFVSAIGLSRTGGGQSDSHAILNVSGGSFNG